MMLKRARIALFVAVLLSVGCGSKNHQQEGAAVNVFLYTSQVSAFRVDASTGAITKVSGSPYSPLGNAITADSTGVFIYEATDRTWDVAGFAADAGTGALTPLAQGLVATDMVPLDLARTGAFLYSANVSAGNISAYVIDSSTGFLTQLAASPFLSGSEPLALAAHPSGRFLYAVNQQSGNIWAYAIASGTGALAPLAGSPVSVGNLPRGAAIDPKGEFLYTLTGTTLGGPPNGNIVGFRIAADGTLSQIGTAPVGAFPTAVAIHPNQPLVFVINNFPDTNISVFKMTSDGSLTALAGSPFPLADRPLALTLTPAGDFLYVLHPSSIEGFHVDTSGSLTAVAGSPFANDSIAGYGDLVITTRALPAH